MVLRTFKRTSELEAHRAHGAQNIQKTSELEAHWLDGIFQVARESLSIGLIYFNACFILGILEEVASRSVAINLLVDLLVSGLSNNNELSG